jgi:hypothetical protein
VVCGHKKEISLGVLQDEILVGAMCGCCHSGAGEESDSMVNVYNKGLWNKFGKEGLSAHRSAVNRTAFLGLPEHL